MKYAIIAILLFCLIFVLEVPMKMVNEELADLISEEKSLEHSVAVLQYELYLVERSIDSLSSRNRIDVAAEQLGLGFYEAATKITRYAK